jgi:hypothetical protein
MSEDQTVEQVAEQTEKEARVFGWVPKDEYRDGEHWVDAETFVKRGKEINPILRKNNETLLKKLAQQTQEIAEIRVAAKEFEQFQKDNAKKEVSRLQTELEDLRTKKKEAITQGNGEVVVALDEAIDANKEQQQAAKIVETKAPVAPVVPVTLDPIITGWMEKNDWFTKDDKMTRVADAVGQRINAEWPTLKGQKFFDKLDEELDDILPSKYKKTQRTSPVEGNTQGSNRAIRSDKHSYENLPAESKAACDRFLKTGMIKSKEDYLKEYDWS